MLPACILAQEFAAAQEPAAPGSALTVPGLAPGDQLEVRMYDFPDLGSSPLKVHVSADGTVHLPYAGTLQVQGSSPEALQQAIGESLRAKGIVKSPNVSVDVVSSANLLVLVTGEVRAPKSVPLFAPAPISYVLGEAGGLTGLAAHHLTILHRGEVPPTSVDFDQDAPTSAALSTLVQPGDIVHVATSGVIFVAGEVQRPGIYPIGGALNIGQVSSASGYGVAKHMTLLQALAQCGGITAIAARSQMRILRTVDGKREEILVDEVKLYKGQVADPILHPDDIIYVPSSYIRQQTNNLFGTVLSSLYAGLSVQNNLIK